MIYIKQKVGVKSRLNEIFTIFVPETALTLSPPTKKSSLECSL